MDTENCQTVPEKHVAGTYSGMSLAMTLVAEDGAKPSPKPTCIYMGSTINAVQRDATAEADVQWRSHRPRRMNCLLNLYICSEMSLFKPYEVKTKQIRHADSLY